jgi:hypothetical protein
MKNFGRALVLLLGLVLLSQAAMAQDALSQILPAPWTSRVGTQLMYFFEDWNTAGSRGKFQSFLTITNTNITTAVAVHFQFYVIDTGMGCTELFDFVDYLTPGQRHIFDPKGIRGTWALGLVGFATDGRYLMTATPVGYTDPVYGPTYSTANLTAISFNWLSGQIWVSDVGKSATWMTNAISRLAVNHLGGTVPENTPLTGLALGTFLQTYQPLYLLVNSFFATTGAGAVAQGTPFGNRLTIFSWVDSYTNAQNMYKIGPGTGTISSFVFDNAENAFSVPPKTISCLREYTIAPDTLGSSCGSGICSNGNFPDFLGAALTSAVNSTGGWLRMRIDGYTSNRHSVVGWFSQYLDTFGGGDYLVGIGRVDKDAFPMTIATGTGVNATTTTVTTLEQY